ncbi:serine/threonine-protein kinase [Streptomyces sp. NPDC058221]|uniref:serine/threonine-protein kinase n=1 Tax=Streptomyces sp. NPDC058221 TaxID=3346388 RepID=UPI0036E1ADAF
MHLGRTVGGRYRLTHGPLRGGTGEVWLARDRQLDRDTVLKRVTTGDESGAGFDRLRTEARVLARFSHPHVVTLFDAVRFGRGRRAASWLVMEYVSGGSLEDRPPLAPERAARIGVQLADALVALHADGIVHGDIKPGNIVVTGDGLAKLADFGAAYRVGGTETITFNGAVSYTPDFASPEVVRGQPEPASDIFSLAATLCALVTGEPPRPRGAGATDRYVAERRAARGVVELHAVADEIGPLGDILPAMLDRSPGNRPGAAEVRTRLEEIAGLQEPLPPARSAQDPPPSPSREGGGGTNPDGSNTRGAQGWWRRPAALVSARGPRPLVLGAAAVAVVAAVVCAEFALPAKGPGPEGQKEAGSSASQAADMLSAIGDHRTADPCALISPSALARFGEAQLDPAYGNFDRCDVLVDTGSGAPVDVKVTFVDGGRSELSSVKRNTGTVSVADLPAESGACGRTLQPVGDDDVHIEVVAERDGGTTQLCAMAEVATSGAVKALNQGEIERRSPSAGSLVHEDACTLLDADALEAVPGIDARRPRIGFGNWDCEWESTTNGMWVELRFDRGQPPTAADGTITRIGGRDAVVQPDAEGEHTCLVRLVHRSYDDPDGNPVVETLNLAVGGDRSADRLRRTAMDLAAAAASGVGAG